MLAAGYFPWLLAGIAVFAAVIGGLFWLISR